MKKHTGEDAIEEEAVTVWKTVTGLGLAVVTSCSRAVKISTASKQRACIMVDKKGEMRLISEYRR